MRVWSPVSASLHDVVPPRRHHIENAGDADAEHRRAGLEAAERQRLHAHDEADREQEGEDRADQRPRARVDQMIIVMRLRVRVSHGSPLSNARSPRRPVAIRRAFARCLPARAVKRARVRVSAAPSRAAPSATGFSRCGRREQRVGQRDLVDHVHVAVLLQLRIEEEHDRQFRALVRPEPLLGEAEAGDLVEPARRRSPASRCRRRARRSRGRRCCGSGRTRSSSRRCAPRPTPVSGAKLQSRPGATLALKRTLSVRWPRWPAPCSATCVVPAKPVARQNAK